VDLKWAEAFIEEVVGTLFSWCECSLLKSYDIWNCGIVNNTHRPALSSDYNPGSSSSYVSTRGLFTIPEPYFAALKRILRYVQGTLELGLHLYAFATTSLVGYTDADRAGCPSTRKSTSDYYVFLGDNLLSWSAKRQHTISLFSAETEYVGVANVVAKTTWIRNLLRELHSPLLTATLVYCDNNTNETLIHDGTRFAAETKGGFWLRWIAGVCRKLAKSNITAKKVSYCRSCYVEARMDKRV
nr:ribonuclease H-like domain-containing protein [Tanacetum cinerariifolium]